MQSPIYQEPQARLLVVDAEEKGELTPASRQEHIFREAEKRRRLEVVGRAIKLLKRMHSSKRYGDDADLLQARDDVAYALELCSVSHAEEFEERIASFTERVHRVLS
jgi:hypothetical protein